MPSLICLHSCFFSYSIYSLHWQIVRSCNRNIRNSSVVARQFPPRSIHSGFWTECCLRCLRARLRVQEDSQTENFKRRNLIKHQLSVHVEIPVSVSSCRNPENSRTPLCLLWMKLLKYFRWCSCIWNVLIHHRESFEPPATTNRSHITVSFLSGWNLDE